MRKISLRSLRNRRDFESVFKDGISAGSKYLVIYARPNGLSFNRVGLSVSKKIGKAVTRNRIKRLIKEAVKKLLEEISLNHDFVFVAKKSSVDGGLDDFIHDIKRFLSRLCNEKDSRCGYKVI